MSVKRLKHQTSGRKRRDRLTFQFVLFHSDLKVCAVWLRPLVPIDHQHYNGRVLVVEYNYITSIMVQYGIEITYVFLIKSASESPILAMYKDKL